MEPVYSSSAEAVGYDPFLQELWVRWAKSGKVSIYCGVPPEVGGDLHKQASVGEVLQKVKATYRHRYA
jgi:hypothetical protein